MTAPSVTIAKKHPVRLGRIQPKAPPQALLLKVYRKLSGPTLTPAPESINYASKAIAALERMYKNDVWGDCVIADMMHQLGVWVGNDLNRTLMASDSEVVSQYHTICGPGDDGCEMAVVLNWFKLRGLKVNGKAHRIDGYIAVDNTDVEEVKVANLLFGGLSIGINLPSEWLDSAVDGGTWDVPRSLTFAGGHAVAVIDYDKVGVRVASWGMLIRITWAAFRMKEIVDECYALLGPDWYNSDRLAPNHIDAVTLRNDLKKLSGGEIPNWQPVRHEEAPPIPVAQVADTTKIPVTLPSAPVVKLRAEPPATLVAGLVGTVPDVLNFIFAQVEADLITIPVIGGRLVNRVQLVRAMVNDWFRVNTTSAMEKVVRSGTDGATISIVPLVDKVFTAIKGNLSSRPGLVVIVSAVQQLVDNYLTSHGL